MSLKNVRNIFKLRNLISLSIPISIITANLFSPLPAVVRQALVVVVMVWFFVEINTISVLVGWAQTNNATQETDNI